MLEKPHSRGPEEALQQDPRASNKERNAPGKGSLEDLLWHPLGGLGRVGSSWELPGLGLRLCSGWEREGLWCGTRTLWLLLAPLDAAGGKHPAPHFPLEWECAVGHLSCKPFSWENPARSPVPLQVCLSTNSWDHPSWKIATSTSCYPTTPVQFCFLHPALISAGIRARSHSLCCMDDPRYHHQLAQRNPSRKE